MPTLHSSCYSLISPDYAISQLGTFRPLGGEYKEVAGGAIVSPPNAPRALRRTEAEKAATWYRSLTGQVFG
jgi:sulfide dehydrogenase [flavocytochrome c] flavoprotein subunit